MSRGSQFLGFPRRWRQIRCLLSRGVQYIQWLKGESLIHESLPQLQFDPYVKFRVSPIDHFVVGENVRIEAFTEVVVLGSCKETPIEGWLKIGDNVNIGCHCNLRAAGGTIAIGSNTLIAQNVALIASGHGMKSDIPYRFQPWRQDRVGIRIGEGVWIGAGVTVLPGVNIGNRAIIGAGSVVTRDVPAAELWAGIPATTLRKLTT